MALTTNKVSSGPILTNRTTLCRLNGDYYFSSSARINRIQFSRVRLEQGNLNNGVFLNERSTLFHDWFRSVNGKPVSLISKTSSVSCTTGIVDYTNYDDMKYVIKKLDDSEFRNAFSKSYVRVREYDSRRDSRSPSRGRSYSRSRSRSRSRSPGHSQSKSPKGKSSHRSPMHQSFLELLVVIVAVLDLLMHGKYLSLNIY
ncbi:unnamed protein product [Trifolium pratense]|uniref:Uncharacterized protein n=1 Tax=Trifolium pratense TaxID=57577 RepID=A0ACB0KKD9_TRIPR|nr:unnamed protein product [Trifolium pratense]